MSLDREYLKHLYDVVLSRRDASPDKSYIAKLFAKGRSKIAQKVGEEAVETAIAAVSGSREETIEESADLLFHLIILWADTGIVPDDVLHEMKRREGISGLDEKRKRKDGA